MVLGDRSAAKGDSSLEPRMAGSPVWLRSSSWMLFVHE
jgi:hypothetical protein